MDIGTRKIYVMRSDPVKFISPKGTLSPTDIGIRTIYVMRPSPLRFISPKGP